MTESEKQNIIKEVFEVLNQYSKTISQLDSTEQASDDDIIELGNGTRITVANLLKRVEVDIEELKTLFLRKDHPERTDFLMQLFGGLEVKGGLTSDSILVSELSKLLGGVEVGSFRPGIQGSGAHIGSDGHAEMRSLQLWEFLEVPELRFNRIDVVSGELWNSIAFGTIESVDTSANIASVKLVDGELMGVHTNDICRGIFHFLDGNSPSDKIDACGFLQLSGFSTSYFTPVKILDGERFNYQLKMGTSVHPTPGMKFAVYGNFTDKSRRASAYQTRTYSRYLQNVNTWVINPDKHIYAQYGEVEGLVIGGVTLRGYGSYQHNSYFTGSQIQLTDTQKDELRGKDSYSVVLSSYEGIVKLNADGTLSAIISTMNVVSGNENVITGNENVVTVQSILSTQVQAYKGDVQLIYSDIGKGGCFALSLNAVGCTATMENGVVRVVSISDPVKAYVAIVVNCEGLSVFEKRYNVSFVKDGENGLPGAAGRPGSMPRFRGMFVDGEEYVWNGEFRDIIQHGIDGAVFSFQVKNYGEIVTFPPGSSQGDDSWEPASKYKFVAMDTALIEGANIAGFMYKDKKMQSQDLAEDGTPNLLMNGETGEMISQKATIRGQIYQDWFYIEKDDLYQYLYILNKPNTLIDGMDSDIDIMFVVPSTANLKLNIPNHFTLFNKGRWAAALTTYFNDGFNIFLNYDSDICSIGSPAQIDLFSYQKLELMFIPHGITTEDSIGDMEVYFGDWHVLNQRDFTLSADKKRLESTRYAN